MRGRVANQNLENRELTVVEMSLLPRGRRIVAVRNDFILRFPGVVQLFDAVAFLLVFGVVRIEIYRDFRLIRLFDARYSVSKEVGKLILLFRIKFLKVTFIKHDGSY